jgi:aminoglycoside phosphotransferase (APT) family kinase protein
MPVATDLRRAPSVAAIAALRDVLQPGGSVGHVRRLRGGLSHGMHAVDLIGPGGDRQHLVVRRYPAERLRRRPDKPQHEFRVLALLRDLGLPAPAPVWVDPTGAMFGHPALVTTRLQGRGLLTPSDGEDWTEQLGRALALVHAAPLEGHDTSILPDNDWLAGYVLKDAPAEHVAEHPDGAAVWDALQALWPRVTLAPPALVHGDYWAGNTLWRRGRLVGVVDWDGCSLGDPARDVGYCRMDLAMLIGPAAPDVFLRAYERALGRPVPHLAFWDLLGVTLALPDPRKWLPGYLDLDRADITPDTMRARLRAFIAAALARAR